MSSGALDSLSYEQMREEHKAEYDARAADKLRYRYPGVGGESYMDIILRLQVAYPEDVRRMNRRDMRRAEPSCCDPDALNICVNFWSNLQETILHLEQQRANAVLICDRAVCRVLLAYFEQADLEQMPYREARAAVVVVYAWHATVRMCGDEVMRRTGPSNAFHYERCRRRHHHRIDSTFLIWQLPHMAGARRAASARRRRRPRRPLPLSADRHRPR